MKAWTIAFFILGTLAFIGALTGAYHQFIIAAMCYILVATFWHEHKQEQKKKQDEKDKYDIEID